MTGFVIPQEYSVYYAYGLAIFAVLLVVGTALGIFIENRIKYKRLDAPIEPLELTAVEARVYSKRADIINYGSARFPKSRLTHFITFLTDDSQTVELTVPQEVYIALELNTVGTLVTSEGKYCDFG